MKPEKDIAVEVPEDSLITEIRKEERERIIALIEKQIQIDRYAGAPRLGDNLIKLIKEI